MGTVLFGFFFFDQQIFGEIRKDPFLFKPKMWKLCCILVAVSLTLLESKRVEAKPLEIQEMGDVLGQGNSMSQTAEYNERFHRQSYGYPDGSYDRRPSTSIFRPSGGKS